MSSQRGFAALPTVKCSSCGEQIEIMNMGSHLCGTGGRGTEVDPGTNSNIYSGPSGEGRGKRIYGMQTSALDALSVFQRPAQQSSRIPRPAHSNPVASTKPGPRPRNQSQDLAVPLYNAGQPETPHNDRTGASVNDRDSPSGSSWGTGGLETEGKYGRPGFSIGRSATEPIRKPRLETRQPMPPTSAMGPRQQVLGYADEYKIESPYGYVMASRHEPTSRAAQNGSGTGTSSPGRSDTSLFDKLMTDLQHTMDHNPVPPLIRHDDIYASDYETPPSSPGLPEPSAIDHRLRWVQQQQASGTSNTVSSEKLERSYGGRHAQGGYGGLGDWDENLASAKPWNPKRQESQQLLVRSHRYDTEKVPRPQKPPSSRGKCRACNNDIIGKSISSADGRLTGRYHKACFVCTECTRLFESLEFYVINDMPYCELDYHTLNGSLCGTCKRGIEGQYLEDEALVKYHYSGCFCCDDCGRDLIDGYFELNNKVYCERHATRRVERANAFAATRRSASTEVSDASDVSIVSEGRFMPSRAPSTSVPPTPKSKSSKKSLQRDAKGKRGRFGGGPESEDGPWDREDEGIRNENIRDEGREAEGTQMMDFIGRRDRTRAREKTKDSESISLKSGSNRSTAWSTEYANTDVAVPNPPKRAPTMPTISSKSSGRPRDNGSQKSPAPAAGQGLKRSQTERLASASRDWRGTSRKESSDPIGGSNKGASPSPVREPAGKPKASGKWLLPPPPLPPQPITSPADRRADKAVILQRRMTNIGMFING
jgi:hypothetical protein